MEDAVGKYVKFMEVGGTAARQAANELRVTAKEQLLLSGWTLWMATKYDGRRELRYKAPHGPSYISLIVACKAYQKINTRRTAPPKPDSKIKTTTSKAGTAHYSTNSSSKIKKRAADSSRNYSSRIRMSTSYSSTKNSSSKINKTAESTDDYQRASAVARVLRPKTADAIVVVAGNSCANGSPADSDSDSDNDAGDPPYVAEGCTRSKRRRRVSAIMKSSKKASASPAASKAKARVLMQDGGEKRGGVRLKRQRCGSDEGPVENDWVCSVCADGGDMVLCDQCPAAFHHACVGLDATPSGDWFCPSCRCAICGTSELDDDATGFTDKTVIYCDQCERAYHVGCVRKSGGHKQAVAGQVQPWLCSDDCAEVWEHLQSLVGRSTPTSVPGVSFTVVRSPEKKVRAAYSVLHECFVTLTEPRTRSNMTKDMLHNRWSADQLRRLDFRGFYVVGLEDAGGELVTVGTLRVYGKEVAELPLVGTRRARRRRGMCRVLMEEVEAVLRAVGVERVVLPAVAELLETWTGSFGFEVMTAEEKVETARRQYTLLCFQGTTMCRKNLTPTDYIQHLLNQSVSFIHSNF